MPQATDELREKIDGYFKSGIDLYAPLEYLKSEGWTDDKGWLFSPSRTITEKEWDCVDFLCDEWDFAYNAAKPATKQ
jgi:hypothetical protein